MHSLYKSFLITIALTALSIASLPISALAQENARDLLKTAQAEFQAKKYDSAKAAYDHILSLPDADVGMKATAHIGIVNILLQEGKSQLIPAKDECEMALALPGLPIKERLSLLFLNATIYERMTPPSWDTAISLYEKIAVEPGGDNRSKITALNKISQAYMAKGEAQKATDAQNHALALPDLKPAEHLTVLTNMGSLLLNQGNSQAARQTYQKMLDIDKSDQNRANVQKMIITTWTVAGHFDKAIELAETELAIPGLPIQDRINLMFITAANYERLSPANRDKAVSLYKMIVEAQGGDNRSKITALNKISKAYSAKGEVQKAIDTLNHALALPDLKPAEHLTALTNMGSLLLNQGNYQAARDTYQKMLYIDKSDQNKANAQKLTIAAWKAEGNLDKAIELARQSEDSIELADLYQKQGDFKAAQVELLGTLKNDSADNKIKTTAFSHLMALYATTNDYIQAKQDVETFLPTLTESDPNQASSLLPLLRSSMETGNSECALWAADTVINAPKLSDRDYMLVRLWQINALSAMGQLDEACRVAEAAASDNKITTPNKFRFKLTATALASTGNTDEMKNTYTQVLGSFNENDLSDKDKAEAILNAAKSALMAGKNRTARELYSMHQAMFLNKPHVSYLCDFMEDAPSDVGSWLASSLLKDPKKAAKLNRKYGSNLVSLLETDASTTGRGVAADGKDVDNTETELYMACDVNGVHFFFMAVDSRAEEVNHQLASGGSYEGYLAPGAHKPYYTFLIDLPSGSLNDSFSTMYPNRHFRKAQQKDNTIISATMPTKKGFATHLFYSWELFYDNLPSDGDKWQFEIIRWTRSDGFSWAGSQSVHNRSNWGNIVFNGLTEKNLRAIKQNLIFKALAKYEKKKTSKNRGSIDFWKDDELGDLKFYNSLLTPMVARLDDFSKKATKDMSGIDIDTLFEQAVSDWMGVGYLVEELRTKYLSGIYFSQK
jgi:tetratricopeptide (TPR) repeat protein